jgi:hypothetical protein
VTTPPEPPQDPWAHAPAMNPEAAPPPAQPWGAPPPPGAPPGAPPGQWGGPPPAPGYGYAPAHPRNGTGTAALILGIIGLLLSIVVIGGAFGFVALILGFVGRGKAKRGEATNGGAAMGGIITGVLAMLVSIGLVVAGTALVLNNTDFKSYRQCLDHADTQDEQQACAEEFSNNLATP